MNDVALQPSFAYKTRLLERARRFSILHIANCLHAKELGKPKGGCGESANRLRHQTQTPVAAGQHVAKIQDMRLYPNMHMFPGIEHSDRKLGIISKRKGIGLPMTNLPIRKTLPQEIFRVGEHRMWPPGHVMRHFRIPGVGFKDVPRVRCTWLAEHDAVRFEEIR